MKLCGDVLLVVMIVLIWFYVLQEDKNDFSKSIGTFGSYTTEVYNETVWR